MTATSIVVTPSSSSIYKADETGRKRVTCNVGGLSDYTDRNRASWGAEAASYVDAGRRNWQSDVPSWGVWHIPEVDLRTLPELDGIDAIELGSRTAYWSAWL